MREITIILRDGAIQRIEDIPAGIVIKVRDNNAEYVFPENYSEEDHAISISWCVADVKERARENGIEITTERAIKVLENMEREHDAELGITWATIDYWLNELEEQ